MTGRRPVGHSSQELQGDHPFVWFVDDLNDLDVSRT
jgi:hypothetical protein